MEQETPINSIASINGGSTSGPTQVKKEDPSAPSIIVTSPDGIYRASISDLIDLSEPDLDLAIVNDNRPIQGLPNPKQYRIIKCVKNGRGGGKDTIVRYSLPNSAIFRIKDTTDLNILEGTLDISNSKGRAGEKYKYINSRKKQDYTRKNCVSI